MSRAKIVVITAFVCVLLVAMMAPPAAAFHHKGVPADECAPAAADTNGAPGNNSQAAEAQLLRNPIFNPPLPPAGKPSQAPTECPAPNR